MRRILIFLLTIFLMAGLMTGCEKDIINIVDPSGGGSEVDDDDDVTDGDFGKSVKVVFSTSGVATVSGINEDFDVKVNGNDVTIVYSGDTTVLYTLTGTTTDGFFKLYSYKKQGVKLENVSITNPNGAAINIQGSQSDPGKCKRTYVILSGESALADGSSYTDTPTNEDEKAAFFSEGQLIFSGNGSLTVNATGKAGITSDDYLRILSGPTLKVTSSAGHGMRGKEYILVEGGTIDVSVSANMKKGFSSDGYVQIDGGVTTINVTGSAAYDNESGEYSGTAGIKADGYFTMNDGMLTITNSGNGGKGISSDGAGYFNGGIVNVTTTGNNYTSGDISSKGIKMDGKLVFAGSTVNVSAKMHEGIESKSTITISDGIVYSYSAKDDAINSAGDFTISGGHVCGHSAGNDGLDANGNFYITGGLVYAIGSQTPEVAIDANTEGGYNLYVQGGTIIAIGGLERNSSLTQSCFSTNSWQKSTWYAMTVGSDIFIFKTPSSGGNQLVVSGAMQPTLMSGVTPNGIPTLFNNTFTLDGSFSGGTNLNLSNYTGGGGPPGPGPGGW